MADFPTSLKAFTDEEDGVSYPVASDMNTVYDEIEAVQAKVGVDDSAVASSIDYKLSNTTSGHDHDGSDSKKVIVTNLNPTGLNASELLRVNSAGTAIESAGSTLTAVISAAWPVGSVYTNVTGVNPGTELGFGTWSQIASGQVLVGQKSADSDFNVAEETGGAKTATLATANLAAHTHTGASHTHTGPSHTHTGPSHTHTGTSDGESAHTHTMTGRSTNDTYGLTVVSGYQGSVLSSNYSQSTGAGTTHTHTFTTAAGGTGATGAGGTGATGADGTGATSSTGSGTAFSIMNPYFVVYFYKRTA